MKLSKLQAQELIGKFGTLADDEWLQTDYGISYQDANELLASIPRSGGEWTVPPARLDVVVGELRDCAHTLRTSAADLRDHGLTGHSLTASRMAAQFDAASDMLAQAETK